MKDFYTALQHCLNAIDLGIDLESCLALYPEYEGQLRQFFQKWNGSRDGLSGLSEKAFEQILFDQALDECIKAVGSGESPESCYEKYPAYARRMKPWLMAVSDLPRLRRDGRLQTEITFDDFFVPEVPFTQALEEYIQAYRHDRPNIILARYPYYADRLQFWADKIPEQPQLSTTSQPILAKRPILQLSGLFSARSMQVPVAIALAVLLFFISGLRLARASAATIPGEPLYPLKLVVEQIHLNIVSDAQKEDLREQFAEERRKEASALVQADITQEVAFDGEVTSVSKDKVVVSDVVVLLDELGIKGPVVSKGEIVHVEGYTSQSGVRVKRLNVHSSSGVEKTFVASPLSVASLSIHPSATPISVAQRSLPTSIFGSLFSSVGTPIPTEKSTSSDSGAASSASGSTGAPTAQPTSAPAQISTSVPTSAPTARPTSAPTQIPTSAPTNAPTSIATQVPPTQAAPTPVPTTAPTEAPPVQPIPVSTEPPKIEPTIAPTDAPPPEPTAAAPTEAPPPEPVSVPTDAPPPASTPDPTSNTPE